MTAPCPATAPSARGLRSDVSEQHRLPCRSSSLFQPSALSAYPGTRARNPRNTRLLLVEEHGNPLVELRGKQQAVVSAPLSATEIR
jgi:hypothetical protein